ncbi:MAG: C1 family peptidase [Bacteroidetes bacterium]|nr:C1 family peptidase [Bacteroidota bacterium]
MAHQVKWYGWQPDLPDHRDLKYLAPARITQKLPVKVDLRPQCPEVYEQGQLGSCTANAIAAAFEFGQLKQNAANAFMPSRLFIYYNERVIENTVNSDAGAQIRDGIKSVNTIGVCPEKMWPYSDKSDLFAKKPTPSCYTAAANHQVLSYQRVSRDLAQMKACLAQGYPFVFGFSVYSAFESDAVAKSGKLNMPAKSEQQEGGHAVLAVGYDDAAKRFIVRNSWGADWGLQGYFTMPYAYLMSENLADDFWTIRIVEDAPAAKRKTQKENK